LKINEEIIFNNFGPRDWEYSSIGGFGGKIRKFALQYRYAYSKKGFSPSIDLNVNQKSHYLSLTYNFN
jgi:hypothetical protein